MIHFAVILLVPAGEWRPHLHPLGVHAEALGRVVDLGLQVRQAAVALHQTRSILGGTAGFQLIMDITEFIFKENDERTQLDSIDTQNILQYVNN